jgi:hypothetical protein
VPLRQVEGGGKSTLCFYFMSMTPTPYSSPLLFYYLFRGFVIATIELSVRTRFSLPGRWHHH